MTSPTEPTVAEASSPPAAVASPTPAVEHNVPLEPDDEQDGSDADSAFQENGSETASLASYAARFREENGRTYHGYKAEKGYYMPNDVREMDRLDFQHTQMLMILDNKLFLCPAGRDKPLRRVLDAGCGTGIWSMDLAEEHPETAVVGVDLSPIQPDFVQPNVEFFVDDLEDPWTFNNKFDLIYLRAMTGSFKDWPKLFRQAYDNLHPGGYIELFDPIVPLECDDGTLDQNSALALWDRLILESSIKAGSPCDSAYRYEQQLRDAGFTNIVRKEFKWPINQWPKDPKYKMIGAYVHENISSGLDGLSLALFTNVLGWSAAEVTVLCAKARADMRNKNIHAYWPVYVVYGQKPE